MHQLTLTPQGLAVAEVLLAKRAPDGRFIVDDRLHTLLTVAQGNPVSSRVMSYIKRAGELFAETGEKDWNSVNPHSANVVPVMAKVNMLLALSGFSCTADPVKPLTQAINILSKGMSPSALLQALTKDDSDEDDDSEDDDNDDESDDSGGNDKDDSGEGDDDFNAKHPRWPAGSSDGIGGEFAPKGGSLAAPDSDSGSISTDDIRSAIEEGMDNASRLPQGTDVAANDAVQSDAMPVSDVQAPAASLSLSDDGLDFITQYEKFSSTVYQDQAGYDTIGYGHKLLDGESYPDGITEDQASQLLATDITQAEEAVKQNVSVDLTQSQFDALVSFTYNEGPESLATSTLLRYLNAGDFNAAANQFANWDKVTINGVKLISQGLIRRRNDEKNLFLGDSD